jgi:hypothetical protein
MATTDDDRIYELAREQSGLKSDVLRTVQDVNNIAEVVRDTAHRLDKKDDDIEAKVDMVKTDLKIYKALSGFVAAIVIMLAWIVSNFENIKGVFK